MPDVTVHLRRNLERYEREGDAERVKAIKARLAEAEAPQEEEDDLAEFSVGGGWYQVGDEKVQGRDAARELLDG